MTFFSLFSSSKLQHGKEAELLYYFVASTLVSTYLSDQLELELDATRCSESPSSSRFPSHFQVGHLLPRPPVNQSKENSGQLSSIDNQ